MSWQAVRGECRGRADEVDRDGGTRPGRPRRWRGLPVGDAFAAGQALAVPRQPPTLDRDSYVAFTGTQPRELGARLPADALRSYVTVIQRQES